MSTPQIIGTSHSIIQRDGRTYIAVDGMTPDQIIVWLHDHHRTAAFGAIRRGAEVAREMDDIAKVGQRKGEWVEAGHWNFRADAIRIAIRAAIRSPKA